MDYNDDVMTEILIQSSIPTFIKLCNSSHRIRNLCTNELWKLKLKQNNIYIKAGLTNYDDYLDYYSYFHYQSLFYKFIKTIQNNKSTIIDLDYNLDNQELIHLINRSDNHQLNYDDKINNLNINRTTDYNIIVKNSSISTLSLYKINNTITLNFNSFMYLVKNLFKNEYLNENKYFNL
jgi:hypothetical protein